jgi:hypothetical protein
MMEPDATLVKSYGRKLECNTLESLKYKSSETSLPKFTIIPTVCAVWVTFFLRIWGGSWFKYLQGNGFSEVYNVFSQSL